MSTNGWKYRSLGMDTEISIFSPAIRLTYSGCAWRVSTCRPFLNSRIKTPTKEVIGDLSWCCFVDSSRSQPNKKDYKKLLKMSKPQVGIEMKHRA